MSSARHRRRGLGNRIAPARFVGFLVLLGGGFIALWRLLPGGDGAVDGDWRDAFALAFDGAAACFLISLLPLLRDSGADAMRRHSAQNDANRTLVLIITSILALVVMAAIGAELHDARGGQPLAVAKLVATLVLLWLFANTVYALHYAHAYYRRDPGGKDCGGLDFPGGAVPDYADFAYFAFTLGMTFQTSDVEITARPIRHVALLHSFAAFVFNIGVIAFSINALGGG